jgi:hypothetical protein
MKSINRNKKRTAGIGLLLGAMAAGLLSSFATPVRAQDVFDNQGIQFPEDTTIEFEFIRSQGANRSVLGIINLDTNERTELFAEEKPYDRFIPGQSLPNRPVPSDFIGTVEGGTVQSRMNEFTFRANNRYAFYLESFSPTTGRSLRTVLSDTTMAAQFGGSLDGGNVGNMVGSRILWDDDGLPGQFKDNDFDDFVIEAGGYLIDVNCPPVS